MVTVVGLLAWMVFGTAVLGVFTTRAALAWYNTRAELARLHAEEGQLTQVNDQLRQLHQDVQVKGFRFCNQSPQEAKADNIEENADAAADNFEAAADNAGNDIVEEQIENQAEGIREAGENIAEEVRDNAAAAADTN